MIYIIISNVGMAIMMIFVYFRYSRFRLSSSAEIKQLRSKIDVQTEEIKDADHKLITATKTANDKVEALLREIDELRKEKENEIKIRLSAEKQIDLTIQKTQAIEKRMQDWTVVQDAVMKDSKEAIVKVGNDLFKKLNDSYKQEIETNKNLLGKVSKNISDFFEKFSTNAPATLKNVANKNVARVKPQAAKTAMAVEEVRVEDPAKKLVLDLIETMKASGSMVNKDYFIAANFDAQKAKLLLCEIAFIKAEKLYIIDFKSCRYLAEYEQMKAKNKSAAEESLKPKLEKYLAYLTNPKYRDSILKAISASKAKFDKSVIVIVLPSKQDLQVFRETNFYDKAHKSELEVMDFDGINNLVL